jgi:hypothetical protein
MGKSNARLKHLFEGKRRQCTLADWRPLKDKANVRRMKLDIVSSLSNQPFESMPEEFEEEVAVMMKQKSIANFKKISVEMEGTLFTVFSTDIEKFPWWKSHAVTLNGFKLLGAGIDDRRSVDLQFNAYVPWSDDLRDWAGDHLHNDFFLEVVPSQMEIIAETPAEKPVKEKKKKRDGKAPFDPEALQRAAKAGEDLVQ